MNLATFFMAICQPLIGRILVTLGFSVVTITGFNLVVDQLKDAVVSSTNALPSNALNLFLISGGGVAMGIVFGAITTRLLLWQISKSTRILGVNPG